MDVEEFVAEREERWHGLETLLERAEDSPESDLGREGLLELVRLYRLSCSDLNRLRIEMSVSQFASPSEEFRAFVEHCLTSGIAFVLEAPYFPASVWTRHLVLSVSG